MLTNIHNTMRKIILTLFLTNIMIACKAQQIIDMSANNNINDKYLNGMYYHKDVQNYLDQFTGSWKYEFVSNKEFQITITKIETHHVNNVLNFNYYTDDLNISYKIIENGSMIYQSPLIEFTGAVIESNKEVYLSFRDFGRLGAPFSLKLTLEPAIDSNGRRTEKLRFRLSKFEAENPYHEANPNEPYFSVPNNVLMTRM
jgi:hypothetical protein